MKVYELEKSLADKKGIRCGYDAVINASIWFCVTISKEILYKQCRTDIKLDTTLRTAIQKPCVGSTLKFYNVIFDILKDRTFQSVLQVENNYV